MLDINLIRKDSEIIKQNLKKRFQEDKLEILTELSKLDQDFLKLKKEIEELRHKRNEISLKINELKKQKKSAIKEIKQAKELPNKILKLEEKQIKDRKSTRLNSSH